MATKPIFRAAWPAPVFVLACLLAVLAAVEPAAAQRGAIPPASHDAAIDLLYSGDYRRAERGFTSDLRGAIKTTQSRWIDSICFYAMLGETYFQQGRNADALAQFEQACQLFVAYPNWMKRVNFQQPPRADNNRTRRQAPWGRSSRQVTYGRLPETMLMSQGRIDNTLQAEQGGVVQSAQFWKVDIVEVVRCTALAIRRRNEMLGPLAASDRLSKELADTLSRGDLAPANHWSNAWIELQLGLAQMGIGKDQQAIGHLSRAVLLDGRYDHALTGAALLAQAHLARRANNSQLAANLYYEAGLAAFSFGDLDVIGEALWWGHIHHLASGGEGVYPPLEAALAWADRENFDHVDWTARNALVEQLAVAGRTDQAASAFAGVSTRQRELANGRLGVARERLSAMILSLQNKEEEALEALGRALERQSAVSLRNYQTELASLRFDNGALSPRLAVQVYSQLLSDPQAEDWVVDPLDAMAHLKTNHESAMDRWFVASLGRREYEAALEISDLAKRRRFFRAQPLAGRLIGLRRLLETPSEQLDKSERLQRQTLLAKYPEYAELTQQSSEAYRSLTEQELIDGDRIASDAERLLKSWRRLAEQRESLLLEMALGRNPASLGFPPVRTVDEARINLREGEALLAFHRSGSNLYGFVLAKAGLHAWKLRDDTRAFKAALAKTLRAFGNYTSSRSMPADEASSDAWREAARDLGGRLLADSRLDSAKLKRLTVVPDGPIWHAPLEAIELPGEISKKTLLEHCPVRYAPTFGIALGDPRPLRPVKRTGLAMERPSGPNLRRESIEQRLRRLAGALSTSVVLPPSSAPSPMLAAGVEQLIADHDTRIEPGAAYDWSPALLSRGRKRSALSDWLLLPAEAPQRMVLSGVHTAAENGLKASRRSSGPEKPAPGEELFHAACGLMGSGPRTVLLTRWTTGGALQSELVREFAAQMDVKSADEAWRRSVVLAREAMLEPSLEPRLAWSERDGDPPLASHPFFWSGFLLLDTGIDPAPDPPEDAEAMGNEEAGGAKEEAAPEAEPS